MAYHSNLQFKVKRFLNLKLVKVYWKVKKEIYLLYAIAQQEEPVMPYCRKCGNELPEGAEYCPVCGTAVSPEKTPAAPTPVAPEPQVAAGVTLAFWGERFVAWVIDIAIVGVVVLILGLFQLLAGLALPGWPGWLPFFNLNLGSVLYFLYWMFMDGAYGQSFGKMVMRLKVTRLDGGKIGMGAAAVESVGKAFLLPLDVLLGCIFYPKRRQRLFNYISETIVVKET
jgi:uncharacterized RDD family membrane protein YckC/ribosomal protein L40E